MNAFLIIQHGKYKRLSFAVKHATTNLPEDITSHEFNFTIKKSRNDPDASALIAKILGDGIAIVSGPAGTGTIELAPTDFDAIPLVDIDIEWDFQIVRGSNPEILDSGKGVIRIPVTRASG